MEEKEIRLSIGLEDNNSFIDSQELDTSQLYSNQSFQSSDEGCTERIEVKSDQQSLYAVKLKEFAPLNTLFRQVPLRAQHGFTTFDIRFTCLDVCEQYICIGSNIGTVYIFNRKQQSMQRLRCEGYTSNITSIKILYSLDYLVACSLEAGAIFVFKVPASEYRKEVEKFLILGAHKHTVTCLEWSQDGMKLFSGDAGGTVVSTEIDYLQSNTKSYEVLKEPNSIVQLSFRPGMLLVSTTHRLLFCQFKGTLVDVKQIGQKPRKCSGKYGAIFSQSSLDNDIMIYATRPGLRLWKADGSGTVQETMLLKDVIANEDVNISLLNRPINPPVVSFSEMQLGKLKLYQGILLLMWNEQALFIFDPDLKMIVGRCLNLKLVVDVAVCNDEIFVLQGQRHLIRIASAPEDESSFTEVLFKEPSALVDLFSPLQELGNIIKLKTTSSKESSSKSEIFSWLQKKFPSTGFKQNLPGESEAMIPLPEIAIEDKSRLNVETVPNISNHNGTTGNENEMKSPHPIQMDDNKSNGSSVSRLETFANWNDVDEQSEFKVYHVKKKKKVKNTNVPKMGLSTSKGSSVSLTSLNIQEDKADEIDASSCSSSLTESMFEMNTSSQITANQDGESNQAIKPKELSTFSEDDMLNRILNMYSLSKDSPRNEVDVKTKGELVNPVLEQTEASVTRSVEDDTLLEVRGRSYPDVVPDPEPEIVKGNSIERQHSEEADIYSSISHSSLPHEDSATGLSNCVRGQCSSASCHSTECPEGQLLSEWIKYEAPFTIVSACATNIALYCVDSDENLWYCILKGSKLQWKLVKNCVAQHVVVNSLGSILCVLYEGCARATSLKIDGSPFNNWTQMSKEVLSLDLDVQSAWFVQKNGTLKVKELDLRQNKSPQTEDCSWACQIVTCRKGVVWCLTCEGKVICRVGTKWEEIIVPPNLWVKNIALGEYDILWIVSDRSTLWFRTQVTSKNPKGSDCWWEVDLHTELAQTVSENQSLGSSTATGKPSNTFSSSRKASVTSSMSGVWLCPPWSSEMLASSGSVVGHQWKKLMLQGIPDTLKWEMMATVDLSPQHCGIWSVYKTGEIFFCTSSDLQPVMVPFVEFSQISCLAASSSALWVLTTDGMIYLRKDISQKSPLGSAWEWVDTRQLGELKLVHISCSPSIAWGCLNNGAIIARVGPLYSPPGLPLVWIFVDEGTNSPVPSFKKVFVGFGGEMVWAIDSANSVYAREGIKPDFPIGTHWRLVPGLLASNLCILKTNVVAVALFSGELCVRCGISSRKCTGISWKSIPGCLAHVSATSNNAMWGLSHSGQLLQHWVTRIEYQNKGSIHCLSKRKDSKSDEDWEFV